VINAKGEKHMAGGTSFYFSNAIRNMDVHYGLVTAVAEKEMPFVWDLRAKGIEVNVFPTAHTVYFENIYSQNLNHRTQRVLQTADAFTVEQLMQTDAAIFHLGPLLANDIPLDLIKALAKKGRVSLDVQGYLRKVQHNNVVAIDWKDKKEALQYVDILKANEAEVEVLTGYKDVRKAAAVLSDWGVKEVVITLGSLGSVIYADSIFYEIPAYLPVVVNDATGCGDTYMAGYLFQRVIGRSLQEAGEFGAAMASLKIESSGPFTGTRAQVLTVLNDSKKYFHNS
jgi:sugar/nucleoside kinase (ribokinase family)